MKKYDITKDEEGKHFKVKFKGVEVGILENDGLFFFEYTNYGSTEERAKAIDEVNKTYKLENWGD